MDDQKSNTEQATDPQTGPITEEGSIDYTKSRKNRLWIFQFNLIAPKFQFAIVLFALSISFTSIILQHLVDSFVLLTFILLLVNIVIGIAVSHIIAGPLHGIKKTIEKNISENSLNKVDIRDDDVFVEVQVRFNNFIDHLTSKS